MRILKIKATLDQIKPEISREIVVDKNITYAGLHLTMQKVFGWGNFHPYLYKVEKKRIGDMDEDEDDDLRLNLDSHTKLMADKKVFSYIYDPEDDWVHTVQILEESESQAGIQYPVCIGGSGACPPEECGGAAGYGKLLKSNKKFDAASFSIDWANSRLNDPNCCRFGLTIEEIAESAGKPVDMVRKLVAKMEETGLKGQIWVEDQVVLIGDEGITALYKQLGV